MTKRLLLLALLLIGGASRSTQPLHAEELSVIEGHVLARYDSLRVVHLKIDIVRESTDPQLERELSIEYWQDGTSYRQDVFDENGVRQSSEVYTPQRQIIYSVSGKGVKVIPKELAEKNIPFSFIDPAALGLNAWFAETSRGLFRDRILGATERLNLTKTEKEERLLVQFEKQTRVGSVVVQFEIEQHEPYFVHMVKMMDNEGTKSYQETKFEYESGDKPDWWPSRYTFTSLNNRGETRKTTEVVTTKQFDCETPIPATVFTLEGMQIP